jgi:hypothetical protein
MHTLTKAERAIVISFDGDPTTIGSLVDANRGPGFERGDIHSLLEQLTPLIDGAPSVKVYGNVGAVFHVERIPSVEEIVEALNRVTGQDDSVGIFRQLAAFARRYAKHDDERWSFRQSTADALRVIGSDILNAATAFDSPQESV